MPLSRSASTGRSSSGLFEYVLHQLLDATADLSGFDAHYAKVNQQLALLNLEKHPDETFIGCIGNGYDLRLSQVDLCHRDPKQTVHFIRVAGRWFNGLWSGS